MDQKRPRGRDTHVTNNSTGVHKRGDGLGTGPVGSSGGYGRPGGSSGGGGRSYSGGGSGYDYDYDYAPSTGLVAAGAEKTRSQVFNEAKAALNSGKISQTEFNQVGRELIASGHSGSTAEGRAKEKDYINSKILEKNSGEWGTENTGNAKTLVSAAANGPRNFSDNP